MSKVRPVKLIVGLGNPGDEYSLSRHNAGFLFLDELILRSKNTVLMNHESKFHGYVGKINLAGNEIKLLRPSLFMNQSGQSVSAVANFYKIESDEILIAHDNHEFEVVKMTFSPNGFLTIEEKDLKTIFLGFNPNLINYQLQIINNLKNEFNKNNFSEKIDKIDLTNPNNPKIKVFKP